MRKNLFAMVCVLVACGNDVGVPGEPDPDPGMDAHVDPLPPPPPPGVQITSGPLPIGPGEEKTICVFVDLPTEAELKVVKMEQHNVGMTHHFILFRGGGSEKPGVGNCPATLFIQYPPIFPGTRNQGGFAMPPGVAITLAKRQQMIMQIHLLNTSDQPVVEELRMNLHGGSSDVDYEKAGVVGGSDFDFRIPPGATYTTTQRCYVTNAMKLFALTSHSHSRTISFDITANLAGGPMPIYHNTSWSEPEVGQYAPALEIGAFSWLEFSCKWFIETTKEITYGETAEDEMCMMFGFYYPALLDITPCLGL